MQLLPKDMQHADANVARWRYAGAAALGAALVLLMAIAIDEYRGTQLSDSQYATAAVATSTSPFDDITLLARSALVVDVTGAEVLYARAPEEQRPLASITKVMTALVAAEVLASDERVGITEQALAREGDSGFVAGDVWRAQELIDFTLITSSNDGAQALALAAEPYIRERYPQAPRQDAFIWRMNQKAQELALTQTYYLDATGLDESKTQASALGSAADMAALLGYAIETHPGVFSATAKDGKLIAGENGNEHTANNTNTLLGEIPGLIAGKTGYTDLAGGNLAIIFDASIGRPIIAVVLGSTKEGRFRDMQKLVDATRTALTQ